jgi:hypothetical protein
MNYITTIPLGLVAVLGINVALAEPVVPGFEVEIYATVPQPAKLAFDPSGVLYVGNNGSAVKIHRVGISGFPVEEYGDTLLPDPDSVAFDASGAISGTPGSVLVGNGGGPGFVAAITPDQVTITALGTELGIGNPAYMDFDRVGRLLIADQDPPFRALAVTDEDIIELGDSFLALTVDGSNRVYSAFLKNQIKVIAPDGTPLPDLTPVDESQRFFFGLEFGPYDSTWRGELFAASADTNIYRIKADGTVALFGSGFGSDNRSDIAFGPDGGLYVSDHDANAIYRITPADVLQVSIDIKPDSNKNPINPKSKGTLSVAVLTSNGFDASTVDGSSVLFGPTTATPVKYKLDDVDGDGDYDLVLKFNTQETGISCGDTDATLTGETYDGQGITATDSLRTVGCNKTKTSKKKKQKGK